MAFQLEQTESVAGGLKRILAEEFRWAAEQLTASSARTRDAAIHEARKSIKKIRAVLRLVRSADGPFAVEQHSRLRAVAESLSAVRDSAVMVETLDLIKTQASGSKTCPASAFVPVRAALLRRKKALLRNTDIAAAMADAATALQAIAKDMPDLPSDAEGFAALEPGLRKTYRRGRRCLARLETDRRPETWHDCRKRVKLHWYNVRLLGSLGDAAWKGYTKRLAQLETDLGDYHNLAVLHQTLAGQPSEFGAPDQVSRVSTQIEECAAELREKILHEASRSYEDKPRKFLRRVRALWDAGQP